MEVSFAKSVSLEEYEARLGMSLKAYEALLERSNTNAQRCGGCRRPLIAPPYGVVSHDTYVCSPMCYEIALQEEEDHNRYYWGEINRVLDIRGKNFFRKDGRGIPFYKYGVNPGGKLECEHVYLPEMVEEGHDILVFPNIAEAHSCYEKHYEPNVDIHIFWGFDNHVWMPLWFFKG